MNDGSQRLCIDTKKDGKIMSSSAPVASYQWCNLLHYDGHWLYMEGKGRRTTFASKEYSLAAHRLRGSSASERQSNFELGFAVCRLPFRVIFFGDFLDALYDPARDENRIDLLLSEKPAGCQLNSAGRLEFILTFVHLSPKVFVRNAFRSIFDAISFLFYFLGHLPLLFQYLNQ